MAGGYGVMGDDGSIDYTVHEAWNEATNVYLIVILVSFGLFMYAKRIFGFWRIEENHNGGTSLCCVKWMCSATFLTASYFLVKERIL
ncbi:SMIM19 isoform 4 [Pan troglodytes]|uniref:Small integral membrane protein 19 n=2 Tax=Homininae TaxID=207598 RepID=E5RII4_HUMAN|nr:small integral membrane protein 19 [Homo sapiens]KAI4010500.1 small integral membrane protein 19 [Homo sapiens]PNI67609.1 SMIM19 isoform 4 [Pan troglodytes]